MRISKGMIKEIKGSMDEFKFKTEYYILSGNRRVKAGTGGNRREWETLVRENRREQARTGENRRE